MAPIPCKQCNERVGQFLLVDQQAGETQALCIPCLGMVVSTIWESTGMPRLEPVMEDEQVLPVEPDEPVPAPANGKSRGRRRAATDPEPETDIGPSAGGESMAEISSGATDE